MKKYVFNNISDVDAFLKENDIYVPLKSENYSLVNFILQEKNDLFTGFPAKLLHSERPAFRFISTNGTIGIEVIQAIPEQLARANSLLELHFPHGLITPELFGWGAPDRTEAEILEILKNSNECLNGHNIAGNQLEDDWLSGIYDCVLNETKKLNKKGFEKFSKNWLLIFDNQIGSNMKQVYISDKIHFLFENYFNKDEDYFFNKIIIESQKYFYIIESELNPILKIFAKSLS